MKTSVNLLLIGLLATLINCNGAGLKSNIDDSFPDNNTNDATDAVDKMQSTINLTYDLTGLYDQDKIFIDLAEAFNAVNPNFQRTFSDFEIDGPYLPSSVHTYDFEVGTITLMNQNRYVDGSMTIKGITDEEHEVEVTFIITMKSLLHNFTGIYKLSKIRGRKSDQFSISCTDNEIEIIQTEESIILKARHFTGCTYYNQILISSSFSAAEKSFTVTESQYSLGGGSYIYRNKLILGNCASSGGCQQAVIELLADGSISFNEVKSIWRGDFWEIGGELEKL